MPAEFQLGAQVARARRLAQQLQADAPIAGVAAVAAQQLAQTALGNDHALACRLLEQTPGNVFDVGVFAQAWAIQ